MTDAFQTAVALADGLFPHQIDGVAFLLGRRRAILADDMGLGKTRQAIAALGHAAPEGQRLVSAPRRSSGTGRGRSRSLRLTPRFS